MTGKTKGLLGCGGCGCLVAILAIVGGTVMTTVLAGHSHMSEAAAFGPLVSGVGGLVCFLSGLLLIVGIVFMMKDKKAAADD